MNKLKEHGMEDTEMKEENALSEASAGGEETAEDAQPGAAAKSPRLRKSTVALIGIYIGCVALFLLARVSTAFSDFYLDYIFPIWNNTFGRLLSWVPFSFGEILIIIAVIGLPLSLIAYAVLMIVKKGRRRKVSRIYWKIVAWCVAYVLVTETLNCFILYQCSTFASKNGISENTFTTSQLLDLYEVLVDQTNAASAQVERDEIGRFVLNADLDETAKNNLLAISDEYPVLKGFYTTPKPVINSYFMSQQYLMGIYFPFTLEANYNKLMYDSNKPETVTHELCHTQGIILEDEANFVAFLACTNSDDADYRYCGYLSALKYVRGRAYDAVADKEEYLQDRLDELEDRIDYGIWVDMAYNQKYWQSVQEEKKTVIPASTVNEVADAAMNASLKFNGVADGKASYGRMVDLLLNYYYDEGLI